MHRNTYKLLFSLYTPPEYTGESSEYRTYEFLYDVFKDMSKGGLRSSMKRLCDKQFVQRLTVSNETYLRLTQTGKTVVESKYSVCTYLKQSKTSLQWTVCILLRSPTFDSGFRALTVELEKDNCLRVHRGVYIKLGKIRSSLRNLLVNTYSDCVLLLYNPQVQVGDFQVLYEKCMSDIIHFSKLSSISNKLNDLLAKRSKNKSSIHQQKSVFYNQFALFEEFVYELPLSFFTLTPQVDRLQVAYKNLLILMSTLYGFSL